MAYNLKTTLELRSIFLYGRDFIIDEIAIQNDLIDFLRTRPEIDYEELEYQLDQLTDLEEKRDRFEYLSVVVVVHPDKEDTSPWLLRPNDLLIPNHINPITANELYFLRQACNICDLHLEFDCFICERINIPNR